jgi:hypothetical protein
MSAETLTYAAITDRLGFSSALRTFVNRLPWQSTNNGISLAASTARPPVDDQSVVATLTARIGMLEAEFARVEAAAAVHRADFERERERCERLMAEVLKATAELMAAREGGGADRWRTRSLPSAPVVAPPGRLSTASHSRRCSRLA